MTRPLNRTGFGRLTGVLSVVIGLAGLLLPAQSRAAEPVKVFILAGQSNMVGHGKALNGLNPDFKPDQRQSATNPRETRGGIGSLTGAVKTMPEIYGPNGTDAIVNAKGDWLVRDDVKVYARMEVFKNKDKPSELTPGITRKGALTVGFGKADSDSQKWIGPEFGFGHVVGKSLDPDVLIIKVATGGTSLKIDWRSPTSVTQRGGEVGFMWTHMLGTVRHVLANLGTEFPEYAGRPVEIAGFGWHQGWNDRVNPDFVAQYENNIADFITDVRKEFGANLPFVIANTGIEPDKLGTHGTALIDAQNAMADFAKYPGHKGNVAVVDTRGMWRGANESPSNFGYHWNHNGVTHYEIGAGMGKAMVQLLAR